MGLSTQVLDLYDDLTKTQLKEISGAAPEFVKTASIASRDEISKLPTEAFALHALTKEGARLRRFPLHTPQDTWLSCAYFEKNAYKMPRQAAKLAATHLKTACEKFQLFTTKAINALALTSAADTNLYVEENDLISKTASITRLEDRPDSGAYALNGRYPLFNQEFVKKAAAYFVDYFGQFEPADRHTYAKNVLTKSAEYGIVLDGDQQALMNKVAGTDYGDRVDGQIHLRKKFSNEDPEKIAKLDKISSVKSSVTPDQFAKLLEAFDNENGVSSQYGRYIVDPYQATYDKQFEKEAGYVWEDAQSGESLTDKELTKAAEDKFDKIKSYFGETLAASLKKHGSSIFESLPTDAKNMIAKIAKGSL